MFKAQSFTGVSTKQLTLTPSSPVKPEAVLLMEATAGQQPAGKDREENITYTAHPNFGRHWRGPQPIRGVHQKSHWFR